MTTSNTTRKTATTSKAAKAPTPAKPASEPATSAAPLSTDFRLVDPATLLVEGNVRRSVELDPEFLDSIATHGVTTPITCVETAEGALRVRYGQRRTLAATMRNVALIPAWIVVADDSDDALRIVQQWDENERRQGLNTVDKIAVVEQLSLLGIPAADIGTRLHLGTGDVDHALTAAKSKKAKAAAVQYDLTIDQVATIGEFEADGNTDAVAALIKAAAEGPGRFTHTARINLDAKARAAADAANVETLKSAGIRIIKTPRWDSAVRGLDELADATGARLSADAHKDCPGHAAYTQAGTIVYVCDQAKAQKHRNFGSETRSPMTAADKAERRTTIANNLAWQSSEKVRRAWLKTFLARKTAPKGTAAYLAAELAAGSHQIRKAMEQRPDLAAQLLGVDAKDSRTSLATAIAAASEARAQVIALALILCAYEASTTKNSWRHDSTAIHRYFEFLSANSYELSDVEQLAAKPTVRTRRTRAA